MTRGRTTPAWLIVATLLVAALAVADTAERFAAFAADPYSLWQFAPHDRNSHYYTGLRMALALRDLAFFEFFSLLEQQRSWPPLHALFLTFTLLLGGFDIGLAIVPSLTGFVATVVLIWLIGVRLFDDRRLGAVAGAVAAIFALKSPAFRLLTADVMLEGLGAALGCLCVYCYLLARESPEHAKRWRMLAIALSLLFFEKYNYWLLTAVPLGIAFLLDFPDRRRALIEAVRANLGVLRTEVRHPLVASAVVVFAFAVFVLWRGPTAVELFGLRVSFHPPGNVILVAYAFLYVRLAIAWKQNRRAFETLIGPQLTPLFYWHAVPIAVSFLLPRRLGEFLWFVGPANQHGWRSPLIHWEPLLGGFHVAPWAAAVMAAGVALSLLMFRRMGPGSGPAFRAVVLMAAIGTAALVLHPQQQPRFQTTVLPMIWMMAGAGWALGLGLLTARLPRPAAGAAAAAAVIALFAAQSGYRPARPAQFAAFQPIPSQSMYNVFQAYQPYTRGAERVTILATTPLTRFHFWTLDDDCKCRVRLDRVHYPLNDDRAAGRAMAAAMIERTQAEVIVAIEHRSTSDRFGPVFPSLFGSLEALQTQTRFAKVATLTVPNLEGEVTVWRRNKDAVTR